MPFMVSLFLQGRTTHPVSGVVRREQGLQVVAADVGGRAPVEHRGGLLQQSHRHVPVAEAEPLEQEPPA